MPTDSKPQPKTTGVKTRSGSETPGKPPTGPGSPAVGTVDKSKQLKLVQESDGAVGMAPAPTQVPQSDGIKALLEKMEERLERRFKKLEDTIAGNFDKLSEEVKTLRSEVTESKTKFSELETKVTEVVKSVQFCSEKCDDKDKAQTEALESTTEKLEGDIKKLEDKLFLQEKQDRKYNLLFYGIPEVPGEDIEYTLRDLFTEALELDHTRVNNMYFTHGHRMPSKAAGPKPIILRFSQYSDRDLVMSYAYKLIGSKRRIVSDLPVPMKKERARIATIAYNIRKTEKLQTRIKDKGLEVYLEVRKDESEEWAKRVV